MNDILMKLIINYKLKLFQYIRGVILPIFVGLR